MLSNGVGVDVHMQCVMCANLGKLRVCSKLWMAPAAGMLCEDALLFGVYGASEARERGTTPAFF